MFLYSHFHRIFQDLSQYSKLKFNESQYSEIQLKIDNISEELTILFSKLYQSCSLKHKNHRISQESRFISQLFLFDFSCKNLSIPHHKIREMQSLTDFNAVLQTELDFIPETEEMFKLKTNKIVFQKNFPNEYGTTSNDFFVQQESNAARTDEAAQISWLKMEYT